MAADDPSVANRKAMIEVHIDTTAPWYGSTRKPDYYEERRTPQNTKGDKYGGYWWKITLVTNGKATNLSEADTQAMLSEGKLALRTLFGVDLYRGGRKSVNRSKAPKAIVESFLANCKDLPPYAVEVLTKAQGQMK